MSNELRIKPLSVNEAWQGRRYKTAKYNKYINDVLRLLRPLQVDIDDKPLELTLIFGLSSKNADIDNPVKCFVDCLQKAYGFNDRQIYKLVVEKRDVKKQHEFIEFDIKPIILN